MDMRQQPLHWLTRIVLIGLGWLAACDDSISTSEPGEGEMLSPSISLSLVVDRRPVDVMVMVDGSFSMCETQAFLTQDVARFIETLVEEGADFRLAVVSDEMLVTRFASPGDPAFQLQRGGVFQTNIGPYQNNIAVCESDMGAEFIRSVTSSGGIRERCNARTNLPSDGIIRSADYSNLFAIENPTAQGEAITQLQTDFNCLALTGLDSTGVEMGLDKVRQALFNQRGDNDQHITERNGESDTFLRRNLRDPGQSAILALIFITDENDCSDGSGTDIPTDDAPLDANGHGPVAQAVLAGDAIDDDVCAFQRNMEDSCVRSAHNFSQITLQVPVLLRLADGRVERRLEPHTRQGLEWCIIGDRDIFAANPGLFQSTCPNSADTPCIEVDCPEGGCTNMLTPRKTLFDLITAPPDTCDPDNLDLNGCADGATCLPFDRQLDDSPAARRGICAGFQGLGYRPEDVIVATIINRDNQGGERLDVSDQVDGELPPYCGSFGQIGYRYQLFAEMFPSDRQVIAPICNQGTIPSDLPEFCGLLPEDRGVDPGQAVRDQRCLCLDGTAEAPGTERPARPFAANCVRNDPREQCINDYCGGERPAIGQPLNFGAELVNIANTIGRAVNSACMFHEPATCTTDADCGPSQRCGCSPDEVDSNAPCNSYVFDRTTDPDSPFSGQRYRLCSGFTVQVDVQRPDGTRERLSIDPNLTNDMVEGDFTVRFSEQAVCENSPLQVVFVDPIFDNSKIFVSYPTSPTSPTPNLARRDVATTTTTQPTTLRRVDTDAQTYDEREIAPRHLAPLRIKN